MKSITFLELDSVVDLANIYQGAIVEDILYSRGLLCLGLQGDESRPWFLLDAHSIQPGFFVTQERPPQIRSEVKPLLLFLKARLKGAQFIKAWRLANFGRAVVLQFLTIEGENMEIEAHLFPQNKNILVRHSKPKKSKSAQAESQMSLFKPKELLPIVEKDFPGEARSVAQLYREWLADFLQKKPGKGSAIDTLEKEIEKKTKGLDKLKKTLQEMEESPWRAVGDYLSRERSLEGIPAEFKDYVDKKKSLQENIDRSFHQVKQARAKISGTQERIAQLESEIEKLKAGGLKKGAVKKKPASLLEDAKGRTKVFNEEITAYIGRSAADNLSLLRKAKAWYIWIHVKDFPGSHGVIALPKNKTVPDPILREVALWVLRESLSAKQWQEWQGLKSQVIYCEVRFVSPIKGDKLGRVRYKNESTLTLVVQ
jgi:predicted ribosome quality control (RQC) complex YloA/Tae2 family protein